MRGIGLILRWQGGWRGILSEGGRWQENNGAQQMLQQFLVNDEFGHVQYIPGHWGSLGHPWPVWEGERVGGGPSHSQMQLEGANIFVVSKHDKIMSCRMYLDGRSVSDT